MLVGCTDGYVNSYSVGSVGMVNRTIAGTVISSMLLISVGLRSSGLTGCYCRGDQPAFCAWGRGVRSLAWWFAVIGRGKSNLQQTKQTGMEYVVETENGNLMTIVPKESKIRYLLN